ncbi:hypothetical protein F4805DRAFT_326528 [Annulohypoxylon moriforme]|nr:hypothetical protein F4805DRAFT_326528 [Annulohypoxylon moriforme]
MDQLPNIDNLLVTADNPPRADLLGTGMDHARCAALHNYLVQYAWLAEGRILADLHGNGDNVNTYFTTRGAAAEAIRPRLHPSLAAFLDAAILPPADDPEPAPIFFWANDFSSPNNLFADFEEDLFDEPADSLLCLYNPNIGQGGESGGGLFYHQGCHRAAVFMHMDDHDYALPVEAHQELWHPLETVLSNWIELIRLGKITASPSDEEPRFVGEKIGPWEWWPYSEAQVDACVCAWDRLCDAIEARLSSPPPTSATEPEPLLAPQALDAASIPEPSFSRSFLSRARRPHFRFIAPGLLLPPTDTSKFTALQPFTNLPHDPNLIPPICLFPSERNDLQADLTGTKSPFPHTFRATSTDSPVPSHVRAGVYSESIDRRVLDTAEEGFRLLLPYGLQGGTWGTGSGARKSDGSFVEPGSATQLFQHGYKPFGGDYYRPQRLERLFDHWRKMVEEGVWAVGPLGVEGGIETFREADAEERGRGYVVAPTW